MRKSAIPTPRRPVSFFSRERGTVTLGLDRHDDGTASSPPKARRAAALADGMPNAVQLGGIAVGDGSTHGVQSLVSNGNHPYRYRGAVARDRKSVV